MTATWPAVAVRTTLYQDGHVGGDYVLTGPESLSRAEQVSIGDVLGRRIKFEELSRDEFRERDRGKLAAPGRRDAARRVRRNDWEAGVHQLYGRFNPIESTLAYGPIFARRRSRSTRRGAAP